MKHDESRRAEPAPREEGRKRPYATPTLIEYGSVAKLTQTGGSLQADGGSSFKMSSCL
jgi:hypothetical protein